MTHSNLDLIKALKVGYCWYCVAADTVVLPFKFCCRGCCTTVGRCANKHPRAAWGSGPSCKSRPAAHAGILQILAQEEIAEIRAAEAAREKLVGEVVQENRRLAQPLAQVGTPGR